MNEVIDGHKLLGNRELWRRAVCQYERQRLVDELQRFHTTSERYKELKGILERYDAETMRMLNEAGMVCVVEGTE